MFKSEECNPVGVNLNHTDNGYGIQKENSSVHFDVTHNDDNAEDYYEYIEWVLYARVTVAIAIFGILGNILNMIILTQRKIKSSMDRMER